MSGNLALTETERIRQEIWQKFIRRASEFQPEQTLDYCQELNQPAMKADVIISSQNGTLRFEPQNQPALEWFCKRYRLSGDVKGGILVHPQNRKQLIADLNAVGFVVTE